MPKITIQTGQYTDKHNNQVTVLHQIQFDGSLKSFKRMYNINTAIEDCNCEDDAQFIRNSVRTVF